MQKSLYIILATLLWSQISAATVSSDNVTSEDSIVAEESAEQNLVNEEQSLDPNDPWIKAMQAASKGPTAISLAGQGTMQLPADYLFIPKKEAAELMQAWGNSTGDSFHGMIVSAGEATWFAIVEYNSSGYIKDDDAKDWDADELLDSIKEGTEQQNEMRKERGIAEMDIVGWVQKPTYNSTVHHLVYSISSKDKGAADNAAQGINYNTYVLGREGYFELDLVTDLAKIGSDKYHAEKLLSALTFNDGKRYAQFVEGTDHVAEYGLAALVAGVAAKKIGLLATVGIFLLKGWKIILLAGAGLLMGFKKFFGKKE